MAAEGEVPLHLARHELRVAPDGLAAQRRRGLPQGGVLADAPNEGPRQEQHLGQHVPLQDVRREPRRCGAGLGRGQQPGRYRLLVQHLHQQRPAGDAQEARTEGGDLFRRGHGIRERIVPGRQAGAGPSARELPGRVDDQLEDLDGDEVGVVELAAGAEIEEAGGDAAGGALGRDGVSQQPIYAAAACQVAAGAERAAEEGGKAAPEELPDGALVALEGRPRAGHDDEVVPAADLLSPQSADDGHAGGGAARRAVLQSGAGDAVDELQARVELECYGQTDKRRHGQRKNHSLVTTCKKI